MKLHVHKVTCLDVIYANANIEVEYLPPNMTYILQAIYFQQYQLLIDYY